MLKNTTKASENLNWTLKLDYIELAVDDCHHQVAVMETPL